MGRIEHLLARCSVSHRNSHIRVTKEFDVVSNSNRKEERGEAGRVREAWAVAPPSSLCSRKGRDPGWGCVVGQV